MVRMIGDAYEIRHSGIHRRTKIRTRIANHQRLITPDPMAFQNVKKAMWIRLRAMSAIHPDDRVEQILDPELDHVAAR